MMFIHFVLAVISPLFVFGKNSYLYDYKRNENCDLWAERDQECINNPRFMWSECIGSCLQYAHDTHDNCERWAAEGECTENPGYIHLHCPRSCGMAIAWNPWLRRQFNIDNIHADLELGHDTLESASNLYAASSILRDRLEKFLGGLHSIVNGFTTSAPTEYLGMVGLSEAFLYALRLHEVLFSVLNTSDEIRSSHIAKINHILQVLKSGYSSDRIMLQLPSWLRFLQDSTNIALQEIQNHLSIPLLDENGNSQGEEAVAQRLSRIPELDVSSVIPYLLGEKYTEEIQETFLPENSQEVKLSNGQMIPLIGLGTWQLEGKECEEAVYTAIKLGYRLIDTAQAYGNEKEIGNAITRAIKDGIVKREELFIATKISDDKSYGYQNTKQLIEKQLKDLQTNYIDLYMLHSPNNNLKLTNETWLALEEYVTKDNKIKGLGLSNFDSKELTTIYTKDIINQIKPILLQNKYDIYHVGKQIDVRGDSIISYSREKGITMMAYSPFSAYPFVMEPISDPIINYIAKKYSFLLQKKVTPGQILLKWIIQRGITVIPRSVNDIRLKENLDTYTLPNLSQQYMNLIDSIQFLVSSPVNVPILPN
eukprot:gene203-213_t